MTDAFFRQTLELTHGPVTVRTLRVPDGESLRALADDPVIWAYNPVYRGAADFDAYFDDLLRQRYLQQRYPFVVVENGRIAGTTRFANISFVDRRLEIGWTWLGQHARGSGLNRTVKYLLLKHLFEELGFERVEFKCDARNTASRAALGRIGAVEEGVFRSHIHLTHLPRRDTVWFSILRAEWPGLCGTVFAGLTK